MRIIIKKVLIYISNIVMIVSLLTACGSIAAKKEDKPSVEENKSSTTVSSSKSSTTSKVTSSESNSAKANAVASVDSKQVSKSVQNVTSSNITSENQVIECVKESIESGNDINIKVTKDILNKGISEVIKKAIESYGYGGYISNFQYSIDGDKINVTFNYKGGKNEAVAKIKAVNSKVKSIVASIIKPNMSDFQKEITIHDYVVNNTAYDDENLTYGTLTDDDYTAYGVFFNKTAVCEGYAEAIFRLLNEAKVNNIIIVGTGNNVPHAWNLVNINGEYYHLDATFDDPVSESGNILSYNYFNVTDADISKDHSWDKKDYPVCTGIKYNYFVANNLYVTSHSEFYNVIKAGLLNREKIIRCKTNGYNIDTFSSQTISEVLSDNKNINYIDNNSVTYRYDETSAVLEFYINYK